LVSVCERNKLRKLIFLKLSIKTQVVNGKVLTPVEKLHRITLFKSKYLKKIKKNNKIP